MEPYQLDQMRAQAAEYGTTVLDLCADFLARCEAGES
jgi:hypothetical protein